MIDKIKTIKSLAVFNDFSWDKHVVSDGNIECFKKINILYGRNYSGKTTLSRIIRALESGVLPSNYDNPQFSILWKGKHESTANNLSGYEKTIRVFNKDFVQDNLSFLTDSSNSQGQVKSFAIIGANNVKFEKQIQAIEMELGSAEEGKETGLYADLKGKQDIQKMAVDKHKKADDELQNSMADKATGKQNGIKYRSNIFGDQNYTIAKLKSDIDMVLGFKYASIDDAKRQELEQSLKEEAKPEIYALALKPLGFASLCNEVKIAIEKKIAGSEKIQELVQEYILNEWVKEGRELHKGKRNACAFCGGKITVERWAVLEKHFDEETGKLEHEINRLIKEIETRKDAVANGFVVSKDLFYAKFHSKIELLISENGTVAKSYAEQLNALTSQLEKRKQAITEAFVFVAPLDDISSAIESVFAKYEEVRKQSNEYTNTLVNSKKDAQNKLRLHEVKTFVELLIIFLELKKLRNLREQ